ncbi:hypothetical protein JIN85_14655 [Luteolibacter pohnpeiensis]|uniref:Uncharacterized protein n=1 Tax=Luteolibacter pohnpeiensis TaxID=454153 RepID=A0A934SD33_9BACT|nr:hypothetical protein [Luteolibacter pohnpeiensis]MBK1883659.1 hypothetical protein [Luteolibacter pohnpeiensis]
MKAIALAQKLIRDLKEKSLSQLSADSRLELVDAINAAIQRLHELSPDHTKKTNGSLSLSAPVSAMLEVTNGSRSFTGYTIIGDELFCTIRISGDPIDNQITGDGNLLHPYNGPSGTVEAVIFGDASALPATLMEVISDPLIIETGDYLKLSNPMARDYRSPNRAICRPCRFRIEGNALNNNPASPAIFRTDSLPDQAYRLEFEAKLSPLRVGFEDIVTPGDELPFRTEHIESFLLPLARAELTSSSLWRDKDLIATTLRRAEEAEFRFINSSIHSLATPSNRVGTPRGF